MPITMEILVIVFFLLAFGFGVQAASFPDTQLYHLRIDCGVKGGLAETINNDTWFPDSFFTDSGKTQQLPPQSNPALPQFLNTLREFPGGENATHCYPLPLVNSQKFIFRAGFYYANYDGKSQPPVFDLQLGGQTWATMDSSGGGPVFEEVVYWPRNDNITVCLVGRKDGGKPFISSLEATALDEKPTVSQAAMYDRMMKDTAYRLVGRFNFGGFDKVVEPWSMWSNQCEENQNRYWTPQQMPGYTNVDFGRSSSACTGAMYENAPPDSVITTAITPSSSSQSIYVPIELPSASTTTAQTAYIVLYFFQHLNESRVHNADRIMDLYLDGVPKGSVSLTQHMSGQVVTLYPVMVRGVANVTIAPGARTAFPPLLNGMEVFVANEMVHEVFSFGIRVSCSCMVIRVFQVLLLLALGYIRA